MPGNPTVIFPEAQKAVIEDLEIPVPAAGELLIRTRKTLISTGTEVTIYSGKFPQGSAWARYGRFPFKPSYSNAGVVVEVGVGVDPSWKGKRVANTGKHAAYVTLPATITDKARVFEIPASVSDEVATFHHLAANTVMNGVRRGQIQWGHCVIVYGLGILGQLAVRFAASSGARPVIAVDVAEPRLELLPRSPHIVPVNPARQDLAKIVAEATQGRKADLIYEVTGNPDLIPREFEHLTFAGTFVVLSSPRGPTSFDFHDLCNAPSFTIIGAHGKSCPEVETPSNPWTKTRNGELLFRLLDTGELDLKPLISHREPCAKAPEMFAMLLEDRSRAMGVVLDWA